MPVAHRLIVTVTPPDGAPFQAVVVPGDRFGRSPDAAVVIDDHEVSGLHLELLDVAGTLMLRDLDSTNGMWLEERAVGELQVTEGQVLRIGRTRIRVVMRTTESSRVIEVRPADAGAWTTEVVRLPAMVLPTSSGRMLLGRGQGHPQAAVLFEEGGALALVPPVEGARSRPSSIRRPASSGLLEFGGAYFAAVQARAPIQHATDLVFQHSGVLRRAQEVVDPEQSFPPALFEAPSVSIAALQRLGLPVEERDWLALGGGLGSFVWVDALRVHGIPADRIRVLGFEDVPYARYKRLCLHSQIPGHERLRSNSESCPDNIWGFPGYGLRESWTAFKSLRWLETLRILGQLTGEPDHSATYTPRADDVFASIDREAARIGWAQMAQTGRIRAVRKTDDGRYVVAVSSRAEAGVPRAFFVAPVIHLALGYPGVRFLDDLRIYRERSLDFERVVNAYEDHDRLYERLRREGGTVLLRGRGIVASRILQRLHEERRQGARIKVIHLMRSPNESGSRAGAAQRAVEHHWEFQPFNWPEACWGGDLQMELAVADPTRRQQLLGTWGGTTTADRPDWKNIVRTGIQDGWYAIRFGTVEQIRSDENVLSVDIQNDATTSTLHCTEIIDATGLVSTVRANPVLADLMDTYSLSRNPDGRLHVDDHFELQDLRNGTGRAFAAGVTTLGSGYAPVDSFLGLQFSALASLESLTGRVPGMGPLRSLGAWRRWVSGSPP